MGSATSRRIIIMVGMQDCNLPAVQNSVASSPEIKEETVRSARARLSAREFPGSDSSDFCRPAPRSHVSGTLIASEFSTTTAYLRLAAYALALCGRAARRGKTSTGGGKIDVFQVLWGKAIDEEKSRQHRGGNRCEGTKKVIDGGQ